VQKSLAMKLSDNPARHPFEIEGVGSVRVLAEEGVIGFRKVASITMSSTTNTIKNSASPHSMPYKQALFWGRGADTLIFESRAAVCKTKVPDRVNAA
jgi:hypothetical protein